MSKKFRYLILILLLLAGTLSQTIFKSDTGARTFRDINILDYVEVGRPESPTIIYTIDTRSKQSCDFILRVNNYLKEKNLHVNIGIIPLNKAAAMLGGDYEAYEKEQFGPIVYTKNAYYFFNKTGRLRRRGATTEFPKQLLAQIDRHFGIALDYSIENDIKPDEQFEGSVFLETIGKNRSPKKYNCYITSGGNLCLGCGGGRLLIEFEKLQKLYPEIGFNFITIYDYTEEDIARFKKNNSLKVNILIAGKRLKERWGELDRQTNQENPLDGVLFAIDEEGIIKIATREWDYFKKWLRKT